MNIEQWILFFQFSHFARCSIFIYNSYLLGFIVSISFVSYGK